MPSDSTRDANYAAYQKAYREANKEKARAYAAVYRKLNAEKQKAYTAQHYRDNAAAYKANAKQWISENPERRYAIMSKWRAEHPEVYIEAKKRDQLKHRPARLAASKAYRQANPEKLRELNAAWKERFPESVAYHVGLRRTRKMQATPAWANLDAIKAIYKNASNLNQLGGERYHVDHEIPLKHPLVCGLHNEFNLRVITAFENHRKKNKFLAFS